LFLEARPERPVSRWMRLTSLVPRVTRRLDLTHCPAAYRSPVTATPLGLGLVQVLA